MTGFDNKEKLFGFLEQQAVERHAELHRKKLRDDTGLAKCFLIETAREFSSGSTDPLRAFDTSLFSLTPTKDPSFFSVEPNTRNSSGGTIGYLENVDNRYFILYST